MSEEFVVWGLAGAHVVAAVGSALALKWLLRLLAQHPDDEDGPGGGGGGGGGQGRGPRGPWGGGFPLDHFAQRPRGGRRRDARRRGSRHERPSPARPRKTRAAGDAHQS